MPEGLQTIDGEAIAIDTEAVDRQFAQAMSAPADEPAAPPKRQERPQTEGHSSPPRRGRPPKAERSRVAAAKEGPKGSPQTDAQRAEGVKGLVQLGAGLCLLMDSRTPDEDISWRADAVTLASSADALSAAVVETAKHNSSFAAALDKVTSAGPYAALVSVTLSIGAQIARNHGVKMGEALGAKAPEDVLAELAEAA
jgi:hypothetical protein